MITDDPGTPGNGKWEVNVAYNTERSPGVIETQVPDFDINYGVGDRIELTVEFPWLFTSTVGQSRKQGAGDTLFGLKYRFVDLGDDKLQVSTYPQYTFNTLAQSVHAGLLEPDANIFLPFEASETVGPLELNADAGLAFHRNEPNEWTYGLAVGHLFRQGLELVGEYRSDRVLDSDEDQQLFNFGIRAPIRAGVTFIVAYGLPLGHVPVGERQWLGYAGLQFTF